MERRELVGNAVETTLSGAISNSDTSFTVIDGSSYPSGSSGNPFVIVVNRGLANEEKILCSSRSGNIYTVSQRGYDGPVANSHDSGSTVNLVLDSVAVSAMNKTTFDNQIMIWSGFGG